MATEEYTRLTRQLRKVRQQFGELGAIVLDHVGKAFPVEGNSYNEANAAMGLTDRWSAEFACPVIAIAHTKKVVVTADMGDEELLQAVMGSAGWVSAVRATMVMWQFEEDEEAKIAEAVGDTDFVPGTTRRKYVRAQVLKHNVDDLYEGRFTLCRRGAGLDDVSAGIRKAHRDKRMQDMEGLASAIAAQWDQDLPMQSTGKEGVFENKDRLGLPWAEMPKSRLRGLVKGCVDAGLLEKVKEHPAHPRLTQGDWLRRMPEEDVELPVMPTPEARGRNAGGLGGADFSPVRG